MKTTPFEMVFIIRETMPQISVIVPVYKVEPFLRRCVDSILGQTFTDFELILVDDGSPDSCPAICDEYAVKDNRVHVIHQENGGLSAARNAGIDWVFANSDSQWLSFVDSDDWVHNEFLQILYAGVQEHGVKISVCGYKKTADIASVETECLFPTKVLLTEQFYAGYTGNTMVAVGKLYARECFSFIRFPIGKLHEDVYTTYKVLFLYDHIAVTNSELYYYFQNPASITKAEWSPKRLDEVAGIEEQIQYFEKYNYAAAKERVTRAYGWILANHISEIMKCKDSHKYLSYIHELRKKLKKYLRQSSRMHGINLKDNPFLFEMAYPNAMKFYWFFHTVKKKLLS